MFFPRSFFLLFTTLLAFLLISSPSVVKAKEITEYAVDIGFCSPFYCTFAGCCGGAADGWKSCRRGYDDLTYIGWNGCIEQLAT
ncbi:hypothetical protein BDY24DRAFT_419043 [Mrakia frigida]|uniref:uncharacterized protein n=1 Tax=Mrakia frigida TaxID=29902 RepID=UPI003FCC1DCE